MFSDSLDPLSKLDSECSFRDEDLANNNWPVSQCLFHIQLKPDDEWGFAPSLQSHRASAGARGPEKNSHIGLPMSELSHNTPAVPRKSENPDGIGLADNQVRGWGAEGVSSSVQNQAQPTSCPDKQPNVFS
jgi:hypothetical protein